MDFYELLERRCSVRNFAEKPIEEDRLDRIIDAVMSAPSAGNLQAYRLHVVTDAGLKNALSQAAWGQAPVRDAPVVLVFCAYPAASSGKYGDRGTQLYCIQDATIATAFAHLTAANEGLGSVWVGAFDPEAARKALGISNEFLPVALLPIGYPSRMPTATPRKPKDDMVTYH